VGYVLRFFGRDGAGETSIGEWLPNIPAEGGEARHRHLPPRRRGARAMSDDRLCDEERRIPLFVGRTARLAFPGRATEVYGMYDCRRWRLSGCTVRLRK
jgi:hypothetical protein